MSKIGFLIEKGVWDEEKEIVDILESKEVEVILKDIGFLSNKKFVEPFTHLDKIFCYGSIDFIEIIYSYMIHHTYLNQQLKVLYDVNRYDCNEYYPYFNQFLFNKDYRIVTLEQLRREIGPIETRGKFIKPVRGDKIHIGISGAPLNKGVKFRDYFEEYENSLKQQAEFVVSSLKHIDTEWRTIIKDRQCITGCQYKTYDKQTQRLGVDISSDFPLDVSKYADNVAKTVADYPNDMYVLDIVGSDGDLNVMEINALSTSGWYDCDKRRIIEAILEKIK